MYTYEVLFIENNPDADECQLATWSTVFDSLDEMRNEVTSWLDFIEQLNRKGRQIVGTFFALSWANGSYGDISKAHGLGILEVTP